MRLDKYILLRAVSPPLVYKLMMPNALWRVKETKKVVYLTFDDGPIPDITEKVLDILLEHQIKAAFFCLGKNVEANPHLFKRLIEQGHLVGNHSYSHPDGWNTSNVNYYQDIEKSQKLIHSKFFRPPYGKLSLTQYLYLKKKYKIVMWDVLTCDYDSNATVDFCFEAVKRKAKNGSIIVFHDSIKAAPQMLPSLVKSIEWLKSEGYSFGQFTGG